MIDFLIAGLGNPGDKYSASRHNIGWMVANALNIKYEKKWKRAGDLYLYSELKIGSKNVMNVLPLTYMNNSGKALIEIIRKYDIDYKNLLVIVDEYNFPVGKIHLKRSGGSGGHNGVASVIEELNSTDFMKLRCGIDNDFPPGMMVEYVLADFPKEQISDVIDMAKKAAEAIEHTIKYGFQRAMSDINSEKLWNDKKDVRNDS